MINPDDSSALYSASQTRELDRIAIAEFGFSGSGLMQRAGELAFDSITTSVRDITSMAVLAGPGNNGGDGYVVAECARIAGMNVNLICNGRPSTPDALEKCQTYAKNGGVIREVTTGSLSSELSQIICTADVVVDALLGTGISRAPEGVFQSLIELVNGSRSRVISLDVPSGLNSDTGHAFEPCIRADFTVTFIGRKLGCFTARGKNQCGTVLYRSLGLPAEVMESVQPAARIISPAKLKSRDQDSHKGNYGHVLIAGSQVGMLGAALLSGKAAMRCGSGMVTILSTVPHLDLPALYCPELMSAGFDETTESLDDAARLMQSCDVIVLGPGLGQSEWSRNLYQCVSKAGKPLVVDADGLNFLAVNPDVNPYRILTPHPGEAGRLLGCSTTEVQHNRPAAINQIVQKYGGICVLKGAGTLVSDGSDTLWLCDRGNSGMSTAGMGDVLSGIIGSLAGQGMSLMDAAKTGVWLHSRCADSAASRTNKNSLIASDVVDGLSAVLSDVMESSD